VSTVYSTSRLIGQLWNGSEWFHGRPSATTGADPNDPTKTVPAPYNAASSGASNLGPTSKELAERLSADRKALERTQPKLARSKLPADMLTTSGSGLDPDISPANAALQVARVAHARGVPAAGIDALVGQHITGRGLGIFGEPRVNVLVLNLALQRAYPAQEWLLLVDCGLRKFKKSGVHETGCESDATEGCGNEAQLR
jgi:K+-transporting ATPase ATPase C chain